MAAMWLLVTMLTGLCISVVFSTQLRTIRSSSDDGLRPGPLPLTTPVKIQEVRCYYQGVPHYPGDFSPKQYVLCSCREDGTVYCRFNDEQYRRDTETVQSYDLSPSTQDIPVEGAADIPAYQLPLQEDIGDNSSPYQPLPADTPITLYTEEAAVTEIFCEYNNKLYQPGEFNLDACTECECVVEGNQAIMSCVKQECQPYDECIRYERPLPGECCSRCAEYGCQHNGTAYSRGERVLGGPCEVCFCPWDGSTGGQAVCVPITCSPVTCEGAIVPQGKCCPVCPDLDACWFGNIMIPAGDDIWLDDCHSCYCPKSRDYITTGIRTAMCYKHSDC